MFLRFQGTILITISLFIGLSGFAAAPALAQESFFIRDGGDDPTGGGIDDRFTYHDGGDRKCEVKVDDIAWTVGPPDPGVLGPYAVSSIDYDFGDDAASIPNINYPVELRGEVVFPQNLECGPFPVVFMMHGNHATCYDPVDNSTGAWDWPCEPGEEVLPNYHGYRYLAEVLASHGIVSVSMSANGINAYGNGTDDQARAELFQRHMELWDDINKNNGPGNIFFGRIDMARVGTMGHSRGGGGTARHAALNAAEGSPFGLKAAFLIGAVATGGAKDNFYVMPDIAVGVLLPYCDGDQEDLPSIAYYDAARYAVPGDTGPKHTFLVMGTNHNYYNTYWDDNITVIEAKDDWAHLYQMGQGPYCQTSAPGNGRLTSIEQQGTLNATAGAFFRSYLQGTTAFLPFLRGEAPPPHSAKTEEIYVGYHPADVPELRLDVSRMTDSNETDANSLGGLVTVGGLTRFEFCDPFADDAPAGCLTDFVFNFNIWGRVPHAVSNAPVSMMRLAWSGGAFGANYLLATKPFFETELPAGFRDVSAYRALQFRAFVDFSDPLNPEGQPQNLRIVLEDGAGLKQSVVVGDHARGLFYPPHLAPLSDEDNVVPRAVLNTVRVPLSAFDDLLLTDIRYIQFVFDQTTSGAINIADIAFADEASNLTPVVSSSLVVTELTANGDKLFDVGLDVTVEDDKDVGLPVTVLVYSDEDDLDSQMNQSSPDAKDIAPNTLRLRGEQDNNGDGRVYLILAKASDSAGALGYDCQTVVVPAGNGADDLAAVQAQANAAAGDCSSFAAASEGLVALPVGYFLVGDGPIIGPEQ